MRKVSVKRSDTNVRPKLQLLKPFGFCCDVQNQDPESRYNVSKSPFESSLTTVPVINGGPDLKVRLQDISRPPYSIQRSGISKVVGITYLGSCKRSRGPLRWYLENEIAIAWNILANERQTKHNFEIEHNIEIAKKKEIIDRWFNEHFYSLLHNIEKTRKSWKKPMQQRMMQNQIEYD